MLTLVREVTGCKEELQMALERHLPAIVEGSEDGVATAMGLSLRSSSAIQRLCFLCWLRTRDAFKWISFQGVRSVGRLSEERSFLLPEVDAGEAGSL